MLLEGTGRLLSPSFSLAELLAPWRKKILWRRFSPKARLKSARKMYADLERMAESLPRVVANLVERFDAGKFVLRMEHRHLKSATNRLVAGILIGSFLLASALLIAHNVRPLLGGFSVPGVAGYLAALAFGSRMIWVNRDNILWKRRDDWD
jgi:ubiquinone biosynthesis protein